MTEPTIPPPTINQPQRVATLADLVEQLRPPTIWPAEWAIAKIEKTLRKRKEPGWSDSDVTYLQTALRLCANREEAIPRGLQKRLGLDVGKLGDCIIRHSSKAAWERFGHFARTVVPILDGVCAVAEACDVIDAIVEREDVNPPFSPEELQKLADGERGWNQLRILLPKNLKKRFGEKWRELSFAADRHYDQPDWIELARELHISIRSIAEVQRAIQRAAPGIAILTRLLEDSRSFCSPEDIDCIKAALGESMNLPDAVRFCLCRACRKLAKALVEGSTARCRHLKRVLRIRKRSDIPEAHHLLGYRFCGGIWYRYETLP